MTKKSRKEPVARSQTAGRIIILEDEPHREKEFRRLLESEGSGERAKRRLICAGGGSRNRF